MFGDGTDRTNVKAIKGRVKRKAITQALMLNLVDVVKAKGEEERAQPYWNAYHCQSTLITSENRIYGNYCKTRFCNICLSIRKADIINRYYPILKQWEEPYFLTLTARSVPARNLRKRMTDMKVAFNRIRQRCNKRHQRGQGVKLIGIKSLESNFNPQKQTYNPHYHLILKDKKMVDTLVVEWLRTWNKGRKKENRLASAWAQKWSRITNLERGLIETIKYGSKIFTEPDIKNKKNSTVPRMVYASALDNIFCAMKGIRLFDRFGFNLPKQTTRPKGKITFLQIYENWTYEPSANNWVNHATGEVMSQDKISAELSYLLSDNINTDLE